MSQRLDRRRGSRAWRRCAVPPGRRLALCRGGPRSALWITLLAAWLVGCGGPEATAPPSATRGPVASATSSATASARARPTATASPRPSPSATPTASATPEPPYAALAWRGGGRRVWGLQLGLEYDAQRQAEAKARALPLAREAGLSSIRTTLRWDAIEPQNVGPGAYDWAATDRKLADYSAAGFDLLVSIVAYPAWATEYQCGGGLLPGMEPEWRELVRTVVARYSQPPYRVVAWEIGNEVDGESLVREDDRSRPADWGGGQPTTPYGGCWGGRAEAYAEFLRIADEAAKSVHPGIPVTLGGLAYADVNGWFDMAFLDALLAAGGGEHFDFLGYHWFPNVRDAFPELPDGPEKLRRLMAILARHGQSKPIWLTETYRFSVAGQPATRLRQRDYLTRELVEVLAAGPVERVYWYSFVDFPAGYSDNERGILDAAFAPKPAFPVLAYTLDYTQGAAEDLSRDAIRAYRFRRLGAPGQTLIAWTLDGAPAILELPAEGAEPAHLTWFPDDLLSSGACCAEAELPPEGGVYRLELGADARYVAIGRAR